MRTFSAPNTPQYGCIIRGKAPKKYSFDLHRELKKNEPPSGKSGSRGVGEGGVEGGLVPDPPPLEEVWGLGHPPHPHQPRPNCLSPTSLRQRSGDNKLHTSHTPHKSISQIYTHTNSHIHTHMLRCTHARPQTFLSPVP